MTLQNDVSAKVAGLANVNASLKTHARTQCGTHLNAHTERVLDEMLLARDALIDWLAERRLYVYDFDNVYRTQDNKKPA